MVEFDSDNLIYNRFDLIYDKNVEHFNPCLNNKQFSVDVHFEGSRAELNLWGKSFPDQVLNNIVNEIFEQHPEIRKVDINRTNNNYRGLLREDKDVHISLPDSVGELLGRVCAKHRSTIKREKKQLEKAYGSLYIEKYKTETHIPNEVVEKYFEWKKITHGTNYNITPVEYIRKYHVTDALFLKAGITGIAVLFFCQVEDVVYFENSSYNMEAEKFSPGFLIYEMFLEELIHRKCSRVYLGGGEYIYKKRFGARESSVYSGSICRNLFYRGRKNAVIWGLGEEFFALQKMLESDLIAKGNQAEIVAYCDRDPGKRRLLENAIEPSRLDLYQPDIILTSGKIFREVVEAAKLLSSKPEVCKFGDYIRKGMHTHENAAESGMKMYRYCYEVTKRTGFQVSSVLDIGADYGQDAEFMKLYWNVSPDRVYTFEINAEKSREIEKRYKYHNYDLRVSDGTEMNDICMSDFLSDHKEMDTIDFLKLNVEGSSYKILRGFGDFLKRTQIILVEAEKLFQEPGDDTEYVYKDVAGLLMRCDFELVIYELYSNRADSLWIHRDLLRKGKKNC